MSTTFFDFLRTGLSFDKAAGLPVKFVNLMRLAWQVRRERDQLADLSGDQLADIGIHPNHAKREAERGLVDLPKSRLEQL